MDPLVLVSSWLLIIANTFGSRNASPVEDSRKPCEEKEKGEAGAGRLFSSEPSHDTFS